MFYLLKALYDFSSFEKARSEGRAVGWIVVWIIKFILIQILAFIFLLPLKWIWVRTGMKSQGIVHFVKFAFYAIMYYCFLFAVFMMAVQRNDSSTAGTMQGEGRAASR